MIRHTSGPAGHSHAFGGTIARIVLWLLAAILLLDVRQAAQALDNQKRFSEQEASGEFIKGNFAYKDGQYAPAISHYETVIDHGLASGPLYYNLGNSYFKSGKIGKALLNYERANHLIPRDGDLKANRRFVESLVKTAGEAPGARFSLRQWLVRFWEFCTLDEIVLILALALFLSGLLSLVFLFAAWPRRPLVASLVVLGLAALSCLGGLVARTGTGRNQAIMVRDSPVTFEPREAATIYFELPEGSRVKILEHRQNWIKVQRADGKKGWVVQEGLEKI